jgi:hypothetical protein
MEISMSALKNSGAISRSLQHCKDSTNLKQIFPEMKLRGLSPSS